MPEIVWDETRPYVLVGGPMDGLDVDTRETNTELIPASHHFHGTGQAFRPLLYRKQADGRFHFERTLPTPAGGRLTP